MPSVPTECYDYLSDEDLMKLVQSFRKMMLDQSRIWGKKTEQPI